MLSISLYQNLKSACKALVMRELPPPPPQLSENQQLTKGTLQKKAVPNPLLVSGYADEMGIFMPLLKPNSLFNKFFNHGTFQYF